MKNICSKLFATNCSWSALVLRLGLGIMILPHGLQKTFGLFGGYGWSGTMGFFTEKMHVPAPLAALAILAEFLGGLGLIFGVATRLAAFGVGMNMLVAMLTVHISIGFFMNWFGNQQGEGVEFFILAISMAIAIIIQGGGAFSIDSKCCGGKKACGE
jgi:putative oxidoreductase